MAISKKAPRQSKARVAEPAAPPKAFLRADRLAAGKALRNRVSRNSHAGWNPAKKRRDPISILQEGDRNRLKELVPIRYGRMVANPFAFLRGSAGLMASDLASTPNTNLRVQACGDCHLANFGLFATPERNLVFDINDFDETLPAPWEWDLKRLAVSFVVAVRDNRSSDSDARGIAVACVRAYRENLRKYSRMSPLEIWYDRLDEKRLIDMAPDEKVKKTRERYAEMARERIVESLFPKIVEEVGGRHVLVDQPPILFHVTDPGFEGRARDALADYRQTLPDERRVLFDRYRLEDIAIKVVGIGSVGTRCFVGLFFDEEAHPLVLQIKEARRSVLEPYAGKSHYDQQGKRIVVGQRLMQSSSDIFLGWTHGKQDYFVRQLRDMKLSISVQGASVERVGRYAEICGLTLARAHAKSGDATTISGYLGKSDSFDQALGDFCLAYANQNAEDHAALVDAIDSGRVEALIE